MPPQKTKQQKAAPAASKGKGKPVKKPVVVEEPSDEDEDDEDIDDSDLDEDMDDIDEDLSLDEIDEEDGGEEASEEEDDDDDDGDDDEEEQKELQPPAKKAKLNGKESVPKEAEMKESAKKKKDQGPVEPTEQRSKSVGALTEDERELFSINFRAMSSTSIFVGKLPVDTSEEDLRKLHPAIKTIRRPVNRKGHAATFAFLNFLNEETAIRALREIKKKGVVKIRGEEVLVSENGNGQCHPPTHVDRRKIRIYGCPKFVSKEQIKEALPGCIDVIVGKKDKGNSVEAVAIFNTSAETKKVLASQPTVTLNEVVCALFYQNVSHNVKQQERKTKQALKKKQKKEKAAAEAENNNDTEEDDNDDDEDDDEEEEKEKAKAQSKKSSNKPSKKKENVKPQLLPSKGKKRPAQDQVDNDDDDDDEEEVEKPKKNMKNKKVSMKSPKKTPVHRQSKGGNKTPARKATPFKKTKA